MSFITLTDTSHLYVVFILFLYVVFFTAPPSSAISDGVEVTPHLLPFMAQLNDDKGIPCGGVLISPEWVLTAAHCAEITEVLLGVHRVNDFEQVRKVKSFPHPHFNKMNCVNDIMLLKLEKPVKKTEKVDWLKLGKTISDPTAGTECLVAGWGETNDEAKKYPDVLMATNVTVVGRENCKLEEDYHLDPDNTTSMVCAGSDGENRADTCEGDSGGPLLCNGELVAITSFGTKCGNKTKPGVYAFLTPQTLEWIEKTTKSDSPRARDANVTYWYHLDRIIQVMIFLFLYIPRLDGIIFV